MEVIILPIIKDNYAYILKSDDGFITLIDPGDAKPFIDYLEAHKLNPDMIFNTHHHWDHVTGNPEIQEKYNCPVYAPIIDCDKIKTGVDIIFNDGEIINFGNNKGQIIHTPGHTLGGVCLYFKDEKILFCGDMIFGMGCGRLFEGTAGDMFLSFQKISALPDDITVYCGHEYTLTNAAFALSQFPDNPDIQKRAEETKALRYKNVPTVPFLLGQEKLTNPFFLAKNEKEFAALRTLRNDF